MKKIFLCIDPQEAKYVYALRKLLPNCSVKSVYNNIELLSILERDALAFGTTLVATNSLPLLRKLAYHNNPMVVQKSVTMDKYCGSVFKYKSLDILILPSIRPLNFMPEIEFLCRRWLEKLINPEFPVFPDIDLCELHPGNVDSFLAKAQSALMIAVDIETKLAVVDPKLIAGDKQGKLKGIYNYADIAKSGKKVFAPCCPLITMVSYTCLYSNANGVLYSETGVLRINSMDSVYYMRRFNSLPAAKVMQNGGYDAVYFLRYNAPLDNYLYDTYNAMHSWLVELPKDLAFITSLFNKYHIYWKSESATNMIEYAAKDSHNTLWSMVHILMQWPDWARDNYLTSFRYKFPNITMGLEGFLIDRRKQQELRKDREYLVALNEKRLHTMVKPGFNSNSPKQVLQLMQGIGYKKAKDSSEDTIKSFIDAHPLGDVLGNLILSLRGDKKAISTYFDIGLFNERAMYELNECGTESARFASKASNFWCGLQIQNVPFYAKGMFIPDAGYVINSIDLAQSESYCVGFLSQDKNLLNVLGLCFRDRSQDFHKINGSNFFGLKPAEIVGDLRQLSKRTNHGANYNMKWRVLFQTLGRKLTFQAARLLGLPKSYGPQKICEFLLGRFEAAYPEIKTRYYSEIMLSIKVTGKLVGPTGWTRRCLRNPEDNTHVYNSYVAHPSQSLSVVRMNEALFEFWRIKQIKESKIRLKAQVHDDIIWQDKPEDTAENTAWLSREMTKPTLVNGRQMIIPVDAATGAKTWAETKR